jgi:hypothetical protein
MQVAKYYGVSPQEVEYEWTNVDFLDRQEYMLLQEEIDQQYRKWAENTR